MNKEWIGSVVEALAGRDRGEHFAVIGVAEDGKFLLANGKSRKLSGAKKKKGRHLRFTEQKLADLQERLAGDRGTVDAYLRRSLASLSQDLKDETEEG